MSEKENSLYIENNILHTGGLRDRHKMFRNFSYNIILSNIYSYLSNPQDFLEAALRVNVATNNNRVTGPLWGESTSHETQDCGDSNGKLWYFPCCLS